MFPVQGSLSNLASPSSSFLSKDKSLYCIVRLFSILLHTLLLDLEPLHSTAYADVADANLFTYAWNYSNYHLKHDFSFSHATRKLPLFTHQLDPHMKCGAA